MAVDKPRDCTSNYATNDYSDDSSYANTKTDSDILDDPTGNPSTQQKPSIGLGIVVDKMTRERKRKYSTCATTTTTAIKHIEPPTSPEFILNIDSGTPQDITTFPFSRRIIPLPSPTCANQQPAAFEKHDIISPLMPSSSEAPPSLASAEPSISSLSSLSSSSLCSSTSATTSIDALPTPPPPPFACDQTKDTTNTIPILSLSPSFPSQSLQRMPNLSELPMLGDLDDDHFQDHGSLSLPPLMANSMDATMMREQQSLLSPAIHSYDESTLIGKTVWKFRINKLLGVGAFSKVYLATSMDEKNKSSAIKMIGKAKMLKDLRMKSSIEREVAVLQFLHHPGIIQLEATMEIEHHLCLVLEYVDGGELFDFVQQQGMFKSTGHVDEALVKDLFLQLISVVQWMHEQNVVHRDLKLENILLYKRNDHLHMKITDFGLARVIDPSNPLLSTRCGSEEYAAPEIWHGVGYDGRLTDTWACGVILYAMFVGYLPFSARDGNSLSQLCYQIMQATIRWPKDRTISDQAKQVVESLLHRLPDKRLALADASSLPWFCA